MGTVLSTSTAPAKLRCCLCTAYRVLRGACARSAVVEALEVRVARARVGAVERAAGGLVEAPGVALELTVARGTAVAIVVVEAALFFVIRGVVADGVAAGGQGSCE